VKIFPRTGGFVVIWMKQKWILQTGTADAHAF
jgi:hypothetical protein